MDVLRRRGATIVPAESGELACGTVGPGRLPEPEFIMEEIAAVMAPDDFAGRTILVTAGPTREAIDPVRFISNPSSGKMGFAIADAARQRGASVILVARGVEKLDEAIWNLPTAVPTLVDNETFLVDLQRDHFPLCLRKVRLRREHPRGCV